MAYNKVYNRTYWNNDKVPAINATNLNNIESGIDTIDGRVVEIGNDVSDVKSGLKDLIGIKSSSTNLNFSVASYQKIGDFSYSAGSEFSCFIKTNSSTSNTAFLFTNESQKPLCEALNVKDFADGKYIKFKVLQPCTTLYLFANNSATFERIDIFDGTGIVGDIDSLNNSLHDLEFLGWEVPSECPIQNSFDGKTFTQRVGRVKVRDLNLTLSSNLYLSNAITDMKSPSADNVAVLAYVDDVQTVSANERTSASGNILYVFSNDKTVYFRNFTAISIENIKDRYMYYELETPIIHNVGSEAVERVNDSLTTLNSINILPYIPNFSKEHRGITLRANNDENKTYTLSGTNSGITLIEIPLTDFKYKSGTITYFTNHPTFTGGNIQIYYTEKGSTTIKTLASGDSLDLSNVNLSSVAIFVGNGNTVNITDLQLQFRFDGSTEYVPYAESNRVLTDEVSQLNNSLNDQGLLNVFDGQLNVGLDDDGTIVQNTDWKYTNFMSAKANAPVNLKMTKNMGGVRICYYNGSTFIKHEDFWGVSTVDSKTPNNCTKIRISLNGASQNEKMYVYVNNEIESLKADLNGLSGGGSNYSTTEKVVGKWIDGRNIYEQTFDIDVVSISGYARRVLASGIDFCIENRGFISGDCGSSNFGIVKYAIPLDGGGIYGSGAVFAGITVLQNGDMELDYRWNVTGKDLKIQVVAQYVKK